MLPEILSNQQASLRADSKRRPVLSRIYEIQNDQIRSVRWELQLIKIQTSFTYESVLEDKGLSQKLQSTLRILDKDLSNDSHEWVEIAMILYNKAAASVLKQHNVGLLRSQPDGIEKEMWAKLAEQTTVKELAFFGYGAGKYVPANTANTQHVGLNLEEYAHASSPLRRYADLHNQRWLKHILFNGPKPKTSVSSQCLNDLGKEAKQLDRDLWFLENLEPGKITEQEGYVLKCKGEEATIYVPAWKRKVRAKQSSKKEIGDKVFVRAYTDLRAVGSNRLVCSSV
jgi:exoribonuclease R